MGDRSIALWIKIAYTLFVCVIVPIYWRKYGPGNFLWFSDIALFGGLVAIWLENSLLASMMAVSVLLLEAVWNVGFFARLIFGVNVTGLAAYMFEQERPLYLRGLSLFHVVLPPLLLWMIWKFGYDRRALAATTAMGCIVLVITYLVTDPKQNVNWVFGFGTGVTTRMRGWVYLAGLMAMFAVVVYLPTHLVLMRLFGEKGR